MCTPYIDKDCTVVGAVAESGLRGMAESAGKAAAELLVQALTWWVSTDSVDPNTETIRALQGYTLPVVVLVLMVSVLWQSIRMMLSRRRDPLINVGVGLLRYAAVNAVGLVLLQAAIKAGDDLSKALVSQAMPDFANRFGGMLTAAVIKEPFALLVIGVVFFLLSGIQWVLGFVRQAGLLVLATMLPLAASGSINDATKPWLQKMLPWLIALVCYKPMAAMIYLIGFKMLGAGQDLSTVMTGMMVIALAIIALPSMMKFFSWANTSTSGGSVGGVVAAGAMGAVALSQLSSRGGAVGAAAQMERNLPGSQLALPPGGGSGGPSPDSRNPSPAPAAAGSSAQASTGGGATAAGGGAAAGGSSAAAAAAGGAAAGPAGAAAGTAAQVAKGALQSGHAAAERFASDPNQGSQP